jgi:hypothetical protein
VKLRLQGTRDEIAEAVRRLLQVLEVVAVSQPYPDHASSLLVRVYLEVRLASAIGSTGAPAGPTSNVAGGRGAVTVEVLWSNRPLAAQLQLPVPANQAEGRWSG